jgi:hypothetical protein
MTLREQLMLTSSHFAQQRGLSLSRVSKLVFNDGKTLGRVGADGDVTTSTYERAMEWFSTNWPEGAEWPADVRRPQPLLAA